MSSYPISNETESLRIKTRDDKIKNLIYETEKNDHENIIKSPKNDNEYYKKKNKSLNKKSIIIYH